jgi:hypothetical protein
VIHHVDKALESFLRHYVPLADADVDVSFQPPDGSWTASVARPTVDVFLWDIGRAERSQSTGLDQRLSDGGRRQQRPQPKLVALRYFVTVWAREQRDEHELLGAILHSVLRHEVLPSDVLPPALAESSCRLSLGGDQHRLPTSLWNGSPPKAGIYVETELAVDAIGWTDRGAPVEELRVEISQVSEISQVPRVSSVLKVDAPHPKPPAKEPGQAAPGPTERPPLRRFRSGAALVMEGRPRPQPQPAAPGPAPELAAPQPAEPQPRASEQDGDGAR